MQKISYKLLKEFTSVIRYEQILFLLFFTNHKGYKMDFSFSFFFYLLLKWIKSSEKRKLRYNLLSKWMILWKNPSNLWRYWVPFSHYRLSNWTINRTSFWQNFMLGQIAPVNKVNYHILKNLSFKIWHIRNKKRERKRKCQ